MMQLGLGDDLNTLYACPNRSAVDKTSKLVHDAALEWAWRAGPHLPRLGVHLPTRAMHTLPFAILPVTSNQNSLLWLALWSVEWT